MPNDIIAIDNRTALTAMTENELIEVLQSSLYPGASLKSIKMVIGYCKAANLDPMQKPVHIVPMWDKNAKAMRDVIMPGIGLYRTQAARSNALAGIGEPLFGPMVEFTLDGMKFNVPEWCKVIVRRILANGLIGEFAATEYWIENYAKSGKDSNKPNSMWEKRPRGQLAKCAQAQALRMAFPEMTGSAPTADEMEGKNIDVEEIDIPSKKIQTEIKIQSASPELLKLIREAADNGRTAFEKAWKSIQPLERGMLRGELDDLKARCERADTVQTESIKPATSKAIDEFDRGMDSSSAEYVPE